MVLLSVNRPFGGGRKRKRYLRPKEPALVTLLRLEGVMQRDTAELLGVSQGTVSQVAYRPQYAEERWIAEKFWQRFRTFPPARKNAIIVIILTWLKIPVERIERFVPASEPYIRKILEDDLFSTAREEALQFWLELDGITV